MLATGASLFATGSLAGGGRSGIRNDGKTYTFTLGKGFRFSNNGAPVQAKAFAWAITRVLRLDPKESDAVQLILDIVGASRVVERKAKRVRGITARGNRLTF